MPLIPVCEWCPRELLCPSKCTDADGPGLSRFSSSRSSVRSWDYSGSSSGCWFKAKHRSSSEMLGVWEMHIQSTRDDNTNQRVRYCTFSMLYKAFCSWPDWYRMDVVNACRSESSLAGMWMCIRSLPQSCVTFDNRKVSTSSARFSSCRLPACVSALLGTW